MKRGLYIFTGLGLLVTAGSVGYRVANELESRAILRPEVFQKKVSPKENGPEIVKIGSFKRTTLSDLIKYPEYIDRAIMFSYKGRTTKTFKTKRGGRAEFQLYMGIGYDSKEITDTYYYKMGFRPIDIGPFEKQKLENLNDVKLLVNIKSFLMGYLESPDSLVDEIWPEGKETITDMISSYERWKWEKPEPQDWQYLAMEDYDPVPTDSEPNSWDKYIQRTIGSDLNIDNHERFYLKELLGDSSDMSPKEASLYLGKMLRNRPFVENGDDLFDIPRIDKLFENGGICWDKTHYFCKGINYLREIDPNLIHFHAVPISFVYPTWDKKEGERGHVVAGLIHTDPPQITFFDVSEKRKAEYISIMLHE